MLTHFIIQYQQITFINITPVLLGKPVSIVHIGKLSGSQWHIQIFQNSNFFDSSNFIVGNKYCQLSFLKWQAHFVHFWQNLCQIPKSEQVICSSKNKMSFYENKTKNSYSSSPLNLHRHIPYFSMQQQCFINTPHFVTLKRSIFKGWGLIK